MDDGEPKKVLGLSIDETIECYVAEVTRKGILAEPPIVPKQIPFPIDTNQNDHIEVLLENNLLAGFRELEKKDPSFFKDVSGVGISTIGVVDSKRIAIEDIARKHWKKRHPDGDVIDFDTFFCRSKNNQKDGRQRAYEFFRPRLRPRQIRVQNDTSARALAEYHYGHEQKDRPERLFYIAAGEGVNAAALVNGRLVTGWGNAEAAHWLPQLHPVDVDFDDANLSGCSKHIRCLEGLCARHRFRKEWGAELWQLPPGSVRSPRDREVDPRELFVFYMSQMAYTAALAFNPTRIIFAGHLFWAEEGNALVEAIRARFAEWNNGYIRRFKADQVGSLIRRTQMNDSVKKYAALILAQQAVYGDAFEPVGKR